jgi:hypothetical protein
MYGNCTWCSSHHIRAQLYPASASTSFTNSDLPGSRRYKSHFFLISLSTTVPAAGAVTGSQTCLLHARANTGLFLLLQKIHPKTSSACLEEALQRHISYSGGRVFYSVGIKIKGGRERKEGKGGRRGGEKDYLPSLSIAYSASSL